MPWWGILLIAAGAMAAGALLVYLVLMIYFSRGLRQ
jgi:hypothetical protein